ncbi:hypothetical protein ZHAS_00012536 [Anopheles sinensis]|uniref:Uncharacterized protein n=1 Tax=Anopheles sinensis TaxID=74873 RepID=A0A084W303_ANOSI|nr:hypothetical protein ZHAS_00012536 [Anopheles sinensis]
MKPRSSVRRERHVDPVSASSTHSPGQLHRNVHNTHTISGWRTKSTFPPAGYHLKAGAQKQQKQPLVLHLITNWTRRAATHVPYLQVGYFVSPPFLHTGHPPERHTGGTHGKEAAHWLLFRFVTPLFASDLRIEPRKSMDSMAPERALAILHGGAGPRAAEPDARREGEDRPTIGSSRNSPRNGG